MVFLQEPADPSARPKAQVPDPNARIPADPEALKGALKRDDQPESDKPPAQGGAGAPSVPPNASDIAEAKATLDQLSPDSQKMTVWLIRKLAAGERQEGRPPG